MRTDTGGKRRYVAAGKPVSGKATARRTGAVTPLPNGRGGQRMGAAGRTGDKLIDVPAVLKYYQDNPAEAVKAYAKSVLDPLGARDTADNLREGNYTAAGLAAAGALPIPGAKALGVAGKVARVARVAGKAAKAGEDAAKAASTAGKGARAARSGQSVASAIGKDAETALRKAVAPRTAAAGARPRKPGIAPVRGNYATQAKYDRARKAWELRVKKYNEHPDTPKSERISTVSKDAGKGNVSTDTRGKTAKSIDADVAKQSARTTEAEKATIDAGARGTKRTRRTPTTKVGTERKPVLGSGEAKAKGTRKRSKTKALPESNKPNTAAVERNADVVDRFAQQRAARQGTGPGEGNPEQLASDFRQRLADVRAARNRGDLPSYEVQEKIGVGTTPPAPAVKRPVPTPLELERSRAATARFERVGQKGWEPEGTAPDARPQLRLSDKPVTKTQIAKWVKQYAPGTNPMRKNPDGSWPSLEKFPANVREQIVQARNAGLEPGLRRSAAIKRVMTDARNPGSMNRVQQGRAPRESRNPRLTDEQPLAREDQELANLKAKYPTDEGKPVTKAPTITRKPLPKRAPRAAAPATEAAKPAAKKVSAKPAEPPKAAAPAAETPKPAAKPASTPMTKTSDLSPERREALLAQYKVLEEKGVIGKGDAERIMAGKKPKSYKSPSAKKAPAKPAAKPAAKKPSAKTSKSSDAAETPKAPEAQKPKKAGGKSSSNVTPITAAKSAKKAVPAKKAATKKPSAKGKKGKEESVASMAARVPVGKKSLAVAAAAAGGYALTAKYGPTEPKTDAKPQQPADTSAPSALPTRDKYGRKISGGEAARRKAWRESLKGMTADERSRSTQRELERRRRYRANLGKRTYGKEATTVTRNKDVPRGVPVKTWRGMTAGEKRRYKQLKRA